MENIKKDTCYKEGTILNTPYGPVITKEQPSLIKFGCDNCIFNKHDCHRYFCLSCYYEPIKDDFETKIITTPHGIIFKINGDKYFKNEQKRIFNEISKNYLMKAKELERTIKVNIETARKWYNSKSKSLKTLALQAFTKEELEEPKLPTSWGEYSWENEYEKVAKNITKFSKVVKTLTKLLALRDVYRQGWKPDWFDTDKVKWVVTYDKYSLLVCQYSSTTKVFAFETKEIAEQFLENFKEELKQLKELL